MNIAMENCEESFGDRTIHSYKSIFIRGNNGKYFIPNLFYFNLIFSSLHYITLV